MIGCPSFSAPIGRSVQREERAVRPLRALRTPVLHGRRTWLIETSTGQPDRQRRETCPLRCKRAEGRAGQSGWRQPNVALAWGLAFDMFPEIDRDSSLKERGFCGTEDNDVDSRLMAECCSAPQMCSDCGFARKRK
ncbi:hypothetical protein OIDMADRAFT_139891 [Oidiodendron maius Zn]|uniref:Uncharacterized protein n=1 Tax=Oidiodendron maius (strain Zn) TaxID=913774 RepID=A0A0C3HWI3_OIDMZ|nr:hypothetical protein OIDMADRAFT_139891 [Oidiodendron maius Zn]